MIDSVIIGYDKSSGDILMIPEDIEIKVEGVTDGN